MVTLYRVFSIRENYKNRDSVVVDWFCSKRAKAVAPYESLIENYHDLHQAEREEAKKRIDHFLTGAEVDELKSYMDRNYGFEVRRKEIDLPVSDGNKIPFFAGSPEPSAKGDYFHLSSNEKYDLSLPISGYYDLSEPPNLISSHD